MSKLLPEGSIFLIPLRDTGFGIGVLARSSGKGQCFGYFFGPRVQYPDEVDVNIILAEHALLSGKFGDLKLLSGGWKIIGSVPHWEKNRWEFVSLARIDRDANKAWLSSYDDDFNCIKESEISIEESEEYPYDRMMGAGSVEIRLTKLLSVPS